MPEAVLLILGMLTLTGLAGLIDMGGSEDDSPDGEGPDDPEDSSPQTHYLELTLKDQEIELTDFDPSKDKLIIVSPSSDVSLDIEGDAAGSTLSICYGDSKTTVTGAWPDGDVGDSLIFRRMDDNGETYQDYQVTFYEDDQVEIGSIPAFSVIGPGATSIASEMDEGIVHFNDESPNVHIQGSGYESEDDIRLDEELAQFGTDPALKVFGAAGHGSYVLAMGSYSFLGGESEDRIVVEDAKAVIFTGAGDDSVTVTGSRAARSQVIVYGESGDDSLSGSEASDYIDGGRDADIVYGRGGDDNIIGGAGTDEVSGGAGNDVVFGASGDIIEVGSGAVTWEAYADASGDTLYGGSGRDELYADQWDTVYGGEGADTVMVASRSTSQSTAFFADFDPEEDMIEVILPVDDAIARNLELGPGTYSADFLTWEAAEENSSVYVLRFGETSLVEVSSHTTPSLENVKVSVVPII